MNKFLKGFFVGVSIIPIYNFVDSILDATSSLIVNKIGVKTLECATVMAEMQSKIENGDSEKDIVIRGFQPPTKEVDEEEYDEEEE